jgi:hypothetical protein
MIVMLGCLLMTTAAQGAPVTYDFEADDATAAWTVNGPNAAAKVSHAAADVRVGKGALLCTYTGQPGAPFSLTKAELQIAGTRSLLLSAKASSQAPLALSLAEEDGSAYHTFVTLPGEQWCDVALPLSDFQLQDGSQDENGALDAEQVRTFTIQELANMPGEFGGIFGTKPGSQTLILDNVSFTPEIVPSGTKAEPGKVLIDEFSRPWFQLLPVGGAQLRHVPGDGNDQPSALRIRFTFAPAGAQAWPGIVLPVGHADLSGTRALRLRVKSVGPLKLHILLEEQDGSRYEANTVLAEAEGWRARDVALADFKLDPSRTDENGALDADQLRVIVIVADAWNALLDEQEQGEFELGDVLLLK